MHCIYLYLIIAVYIALYIKNSFIFDYVIVNYDTISYIIKLIYYFTVYYI